MLQPPLGAAGTVGRTHVALSPSDARAQASPGGQEVPLPHESVQRPARHVPTEQPVAAVHGSPRYACAGAQMRAPASTQVKSSGQLVSTEHTVVHQLVVPRVAQNAPDAQSPLSTQAPPAGERSPRAQRSPEQWKPAPHTASSPLHARVQNGTASVVTHSALPQSAFAAQGSPMPRALATSAAGRHAPHPVGAAPQTSPSGHVPVSPTHASRQRTLPSPGSTQCSDAQSVAVVHAAPFASAPRTTG